MRRFREWRQRRAIRRVRGHMAALGAPVDHLSDEELIRRIVALGRAANRASLPSREAARRLAEFSRAAKESGRW